MTVFAGVRSADVAERLAAIDALAVHASDDRIVPALIDCLADDSKAVQRRAAEAFAALWARGIAVQPVLSAALRSAIPRQRWGAAFALSLIAAPSIEALPVLLEALGAEDGDVRWAAADILVRMKGEVGLTDGLQALLRAGTAAQRKMAAYCLRDLNVQTAHAEQGLREALTDVDAGVRLAAMSSLARLGSDRQVVAALLVERLTDANDGVRRAAAAVLGNLGESSAAVLAALKAAATGGDPSLQRAAARALRLLKP